MVHQVVGNFPNFPCVWVRDRRLHPARIIRGLEDMLAGSASHRDDHIIMPTALCRTLWGGIPPRKVLIFLPRYPTRLVMASLDRHKPVPRDPFATQPAYASANPYGSRVCAHSQPGQAMGFYSSPADPPGNVLLTAEAVRAFPWVKDTLDKSNEGWGRPVPPCNLCRLLRNLKSV